ncbi:MAG: hypothetical protein J0665_16425 [Deltaproteobacteria bacterium]|nr:hypothetical protein [Deltaproteobacteria bacterium]
MSLTEQIKEVMADCTGAAHINDIAKMIVDRFPNIQIKPDQLPDKISAALSADTRKTGTKSSFSKVKNNSGGFKRGVYRLKRKPVVTPKPTLAPVLSTQYIGKAGEAAVMSELLFYGFNASAMAVDDGIDIIASKNNKYFHIQVKTSTPSDNWTFGFSIKKSSFVAKDSFQTFYVFLLRGCDNSRYYNDYLILPSSEVRKLIGVGIIEDGQALSLRIQRDTRGRYILNSKQDVTISVNTFSQIA